MYSVYIHTFPNGKKYVGVTSRKPYLRWGANGCNYRNSPFLYNAIQKYGWDNIKHEIIAENLSVEEASKLEIELISKYKTSEKKYGYNISLGGVGNLGIMSDSTKEKLREANIGKTMSEEAKRKIGKFNKGRHHTEEARKHMSEAQKKNFHNGNNAMHSPEARAKAAQKNRGKSRSYFVIQKASEAKFHPVINLITLTKYESIKKASECTLVNSSTIIRNCRGYNKNAKWAYLGDDGISEVEYKNMINRQKGENDDMENMRLRMKIAMKKANLTIRETAEKIGCCKATLGSDTKKQDTKASTIFKFCQVTNCDANWLLGLTKEYKKLKE